MVVENFVCEVIDYFDDGIVLCFKVILDLMFGGVIFDFIGIGL